MNWLQSVESLPDNQRARSWRKPSRIYGFEKRRPWFRYFRLFSGFVGLMIVVYLLYLLFRFITRNTIAVALISTPQQSIETLPSAPDVGMLQNLEGLTSSVQSVAVKDLESSWDQLDEFSDPKTLVIFLNLLANREVDRENRTSDLYVYRRGMSLLGDGTQGTGDAANSDKIPLRDFFKKMQTMQKEIRRRKRRPQRVLLLIDVNHMPLDSRLGNLGFRVDDAVRELMEQELPASKFPYVVGILSSALNDGSHASIDFDAFGQSAFSHFCGKGLSGEADLDRDRRIRVGELFQYLQARIAHWTTNNRESILLAPPVMIPDPADLISEERIGERKRKRTARADFDLLRAAADYSIPTHVSPQQIAATFSGDLELLKPYWQDLDAWHSGAGPQYHRYHPALWRQFVQKIRYAEQRILSGNFSFHRNEWQESINGIRSKLTAASSNMKQAVAAHAADDFVDQSLIDLIPDFPRQSDRTDSPQTLARSSQGLDPSWQILRNLLVNAQHCGVPGASPMSPAVQRALDETIQLSHKSNRILACPLQTFLWVESEYIDGERRRRLTEDLLFIEAEAESLQKHPESMAAADEKLGNCLKEIKLLEKSYAILYRAIDDLSYFARWRAHNFDCYDVRNTSATAFRRKLFDEISQSSAKDANELLNAAAGNPSANRLEQLLESHLPAMTDAEAKLDFRMDADVFAAMAQTVYLQELLLLNAPDSSDREAIRKTSEGIEKTLDSIRAEINRRGKELIDPAHQPQPSDRIEILTLLEYPYLKADHREKLLTYVRRYEARLHSDSVGFEGASTANPEDVLDEADLGRFIVDRGLWHALWEIKIISLADQARAANLLKNEWSNVAAAVNSADSGLQLTQLHILAREIKNFWNACVATIDHKAGDGIGGETGQTEGSPFKDRVRRLTEADLMTRILPLYDLQYLAGDDRSPYRQIQQIRLCERLLFAAERSVRDFWTTECDPTQIEKHWYSDAYKKYRQEALIVAKDVGIQATPDFDDELQRLEQLKEHFDGFSMSIKHGYSRDQPFEFTSANSAAKCRFAVAARGEFSNDFAPEGIPACGLSHSAAKIRSTPKRSAAQADGQADDIEIALELVNPDPSADCGNEPVELTPFAFYRGHVWKGTKQDAIFVKPCRENGRFIEHLARKGQDAGLVVGGESAHAVLFILDCSYSMNQDLKGKDGGKPSKFELAQKTLKTIIGQRNEPQQVGLMVFAHRIGKETGKPGDRFLEWQQLRPFPNDLRLADDVETLVDIEICNQAQRTRLMNAVVGIHNKAGEPVDLEPRGATPSVKSIQLAGESARRRKQPITIVMVTDGIASDIDRTALVQEVSGYVQAGDVDLNVVLFAFAVAPDERARFNEFKRKVEGDWSGNLLEAENADALEKKLQESLRPYTYTVRDELGKFIESLPLGRPVSKNLAPGQYQVTVDYFRNGKPQTIDLFPGQNAEWRVDWGKRRLVRRRPEGKYVAIDPLASSGPGIPNLLLHAGHFHRTSDGSVSFELSLDVETREADQTDQQARRPNEISFDVTIEREGRIERPSGKVTIQEQANVPVPTWRFCVAALPEATSNIRVQAWWKMDRTKPDHVLDLKDLENPGGSFTEIPGTNLQALAFQFEGKWEIQIQERDHESAGPFPEFLLPLYRFELGQGKPNGDIDRYDNSATHEMEIIENDRLVKVRFPANEKFEQLAITTLESLRKDAVYPTDKRAEDPENERGIVLNMDGLESTDTLTSCEEANDDE
ncbi:MAG: VWA domain-containing protein [Planctomycetaceae bacterium]